VCLTTHNQSLKSTSICIQDILELAASTKVSSTSYNKFMRYGMKLHDLRRTNDTKFGPAIAVNLIRVSSEN